MSYPSYTPTPGTLPPPTSTTYPYGAYQPLPSGNYGHPQTPGAYSYQTPGTYSAGVTGYGWTYPYSYLPQHHQSALHVQRNATPSSTPLQTQAPTSPMPPPVPQRAAIFTSYTPSHLRESATVSSGGSASRTSRRQSNLKGLFTKELKNLMYGFGDDRNPANDTVNVMEEILIEYITDVCQTAGGPARKSRLSIEDLRRALSRPADAKKLARMEELLFMQEDIKRARAQFDEAEIHHPKEF